MIEKFPDRQNDNIDDNRSDLVSHTEVNKNGEDEGASAIIDIKETGFSAVSKLSELTGVDKGVLRSAFNAACVNEKDPTGSTIEASTIWRYYLDKQSNDNIAEEAMSEQVIDDSVANENPPVDPANLEAKKNEQQERVFAAGLRQIENGQLTAPFDKRGFELNHPHTVAYLKKVIEESNDPKNVEKAERLLNLQNEIAATMGL